RVHAAVRHGRRSDGTAALREVAGGDPVSVFQDESRLLAPPPVLPERIPSSLTGLRVVPVRHPGRWVATGAVAVLLAMVLSSLVTNDRWQWSVVAQYLTWPSVLTGL